MHHCFVLTLYDLLLVNVHTLLEANVLFWIVLRNQSLLLYIQSCFFFVCVCGCVCYSSHLVLQRNSDLVSIFYFDFFTVYLFGGGDGVVVAKRTFIAYHYMWNYFTETHFQRVIVAKATWFNFPCHCCWFEYIFLLQHFTFHVLHIFNIQSLRHHHFGFNIWLVSNLQSFLFRVFFSPSDPRKETESSILVFWQSKDSHIRKMWMGGTGIWEPNNGSCTKFHKV